jgi:hypothetical protein
MTARQFADQLLPPLRTIMKRFDDEKATRDIIHQHLSTNALATPCVTILPPAHITDEQLCGAVRSMLSYQHDIDIQSFTVGPYTHCPSFDSSYVHWSNINGT